MAEPKHIQLLLVEDSVEDEQLLREAMTEIVEAPHWPNWHTCEMIPAGCLEEALGYLRATRFNAILLNLSLPDGDTLLDNFARVQAAAGSTPIIVLADEEDEHLSHILLREGAQDVLCKSDLECAPLARSLRYAIERQKRAQAFASISFFDELTGLYNARGFSALAEHDRQVADRLDTPLLIGLVELAGIPEDADTRSREDRDLVLIRAAELLRSYFAEDTVVGRVGPNRFGVCSAWLTETGLECMVDRFEHGLEDLNAAFCRYPISLRVGSATYCSAHPGGVSELLEEAAGRLGPNLGMLAVENRS